MKKISIFLLAAATMLLGAGCENSTDTDATIPVTSVTLDATLSRGIAMVVGDTRNIAGHVTVLPEDATDKTETYESSNTAVVTVDEAGTLTAVDAGQAMITVGVGGRYAHFSVQVEAKRVPVTAVTLPEEWQNGVTLKVGSTLDIAGKVTITPSNATSTDESYASADEAVATVSEAGVVTAVAPGATQITITVDEVSASLALTVEKVAVEAVLLNDELKREIALEVGQTYELAGKVTIQPENATFKAESYTSSDPAVASVNAAGHVEAKAMGEAEMTITVDGVASQPVKFVVTQRIPVQSVTLSDELKNGVTLMVGETLELAGKFTITPDNATEREESFTSSQSTVASVDEKGHIEALAKGETQITITVGGVSAAPFTVTVEEIPVALEKIEILNGDNATQGSASVVLGASTTFNLYEHLKLTPENQNEGVRYVMYGTEDIATIDENGIVTCKGVGTVTFVILAKSNDSGNLSNDFKAGKSASRMAYFAVNVTDPHDLDRTGWKVSAASGAITGTAGSDVAPFDDKFDPNVFGTVLGSNFAIPRANSAGTQNWFVVDMQSEKSVNYVRIMHQSCRNTDRGCRWFKFVEILGSNDGEQFTTIATNVDVTRLEYQNGIDPNDGGSRNLDDYRTSTNMKFPQTVKYRYIKFVGDNTCWLPGSSNGTCQIAELYFGLDE